MDEPENRSVAAPSPSEPPQETGNSGPPPEIRDAVLSKLEPIIGHLQPAQEARLVEETISLAVQISGPIPPAIVLKGIDNIVPGGAERIIKMAENDQRHSHEMDRRQVNYPFIYQIAGLIGGTLIAALAIGGAVYSGTHGQPMLGGAIIGGTLVSVVGVLVKGAWSQTKASPPPQSASKSKPAKKRKR